MKKIMALAAGLFAAININASASISEIKIDSVNNQLIKNAGSISFDDSSRVALKRNRYMGLEDRYVLTGNYGGWASNWFIGAQGGVSAFVGTPLGCADLFDRLTPDIHIYAGKWFTPAVGIRLNYQGYQFKDCELTKTRMQSYHADLMFNLLSYRYRKGMEQKVDVVPYLGLGLIHNSGIGGSPFTLNYGIQTKFHLNERLHLTAELGGLTTFRDFDGYGERDKFGDHKFDLSIGLSVNLGKVGFRSRVNTPHVGLTSAKAYTKSQNVLSENKRLGVQIENNVTNSTNAKQSTYPVNDYSGLNSLRARLAEAKNNKTNNNANNQIDSSDNASRQCFCDGDCKCGVDGDACADNGCAANSDGQSASAGQQQDIDFSKPYYCYFRINTHRLTDESQLACLGALVEYAKANGMTIRVTGAADIATGTVAVNQRLSEERADYIAGQLIALGMDGRQIQKSSLGGIAEYNPIAKNRMVKIELVPTSI